METLPEYEHLSRADDGPVVPVALTWPEVHNALNAALIGEVTEPIEALGTMTQLIVELRVGEEDQECLGAFLEKREPFWRGT